MSVSHHPTMAQHVLWYRMEEHTQLSPIVAQREIYRADVGRALNLRNIQGKFDSRPSVFGEMAHVPAQTQNRDAQEIVSQTMRKYNRRTPSTT